MRNILIIVLLFALSAACYATDFSVSTPWNDPELFGEDSWQVVWAGKLSGFGRFIGRELGGWWGKIVQKDIKQRQKARKEELREKVPSLHLYLHEPWPHKMEFYKELEKEIQGPEDLTNIIEHLREIEKKYGEKLNNSFIEYRKDLEHIRDYWKEQKEFEQLSQQTTITIMIGILVLLVKITANLAGVPL